MFRTSIGFLNFAVRCLSSLYCSCLFFSGWCEGMQFQGLHLNIPTICAILKHFLSLTHIFSSTPVSDKVRGNLFMSFLYVYFLFSLPPSSSSCLLQHIKHAAVYTALPQPILSLSLFASCYAILQLPCFLFWYFHFFFFFPRRENLIFDEKSLHECKSSGTGEPERCVCKDNSDSNIH